jgi:hypothetical protein
MMLFFIGLGEMIIATIWTRFVSQGKMVASASVTFVNILIWYYVLQEIISDMSDWTVIVLYAAGCACGTMTAMFLFDRERKPKEHHSNNSEIELVLPDTV